jgi:hypothetical protein
MMHSGVVSRIALLPLVFSALGAFGGLGAACGGEIEAAPIVDGNPNNPPGSPNGPRDGGGVKPEAGPGLTDGGAREDATYTDPVCKDAGPAPPQNRCDAFQQTGCRSGEGCYPFVVYPSGPCEQERYGTNCSPAGSLATGQPCGGGGARCAPGNVCVITGSGTKCMHICRLGEANACPEGQICSPVDVAGYAACLM